MPAKTSVSSIHTLPHHPDFLDYALEKGFRDLHIKIDPKTGMRAIIAIHSTTLGPALGGCRFIHYPDNLSALYDAMRLARGMSYKAALANLPLGGGKSVILKPSTPFDRKGYFLRFGEFINELNGLYITALDSGTNLDDMDIINTKTPYVASLSSDNSNPSPYTAQGVLRGIQAAVLFQLGKESLADLRIAIQGLGHVGYTLAKKLHHLGAKLIVADVNADQVARAIKEFKAEAVDTTRIHEVTCDVFSPCALGGVINDDTIHGLKTTIIAGAANNQLAHAYHGQLLHDKGILYAPDYVINAGGLILAAHRYLKRSDDIIMNQIDAIYTTLMQIFTRARYENQPVNQVADQLAEEKLSENAQ